MASRGSTMRTSVIDGMRRVDSTAAARPIAATSPARTVTLSNHSVPGPLLDAKSHDSPPAATAPMAIERTRALTIRNTATMAMSVSVVTSPHEIVGVVAESRQAVGQLEAVRQERVDVDPQRLSGIDLGVHRRPRPFDAAQLAAVDGAQAGIADRRPA